MLALVEKNKPKCCYCLEDARGRICYIGNDSQVVDNPFCQEDESEVYKQTCILLQKMHGSHTKGEWVVIQRWSSWDSPPAMPPNEGQLLIKGVRRANYD